jgi:cytochrome c oxidase subunit III
VSVSILFVLVGLGILGWWLLARQLTARPWEKAQSLVDDQYGAHGLAVAPGRVGLWVLMAVITSFFGLFISAYNMRMMVPDWQPLTEPKLLWLNTAMLIGSSLAFQWTSAAAELGDAPRVKTGLIVTGVLTIAFLAGQLLAWRELQASGAFLAGSPAIAFFYLLTAVHGVHLLGGLSVWARTTVMMWRGGSELGRVRLSVGLCAMYWHYLLLVWLVLFGLLLAT